MAIECIIFDFDGVILESANLKTEIFLELFSDFPQYRQEIYEYQIAHMGISRYHKFQYFYENLFHLKYTKEIQDELGMKFSNMTQERVLNAPFVLGAKEFLQRNFEAISLYIASGTPEEELLEIARKRELDGYFKGIFGSPKNKEEIVEMIISKDAFDRSEVLFVGDALTDFDAARACHLNFIGRVAPEDANPFPQEVSIVSDLMYLQEKL